MNIMLLYKYLIILYKLYHITFWLYYNYDRMIISSNICITIDVTM